MSSGEDNNPSRMMEQEEDSNKRTALAGQWRTPPQPVFPTSSTMDAQQAPGAHNAEVAPADGGSSMSVGLPPVSELPDSTEDYAKALQEAYRRGAEAAAAMAVSQVPPMMTGAVSCPDFQVNIHANNAQPPAAVASASTMKQEPVPILPPPIPNPLSSPNAAMPPPPPPQQQQQPHQSSIQKAPPQPAPVAVAHAPASSSAAAASLQAQQRSMSLPDMASYGAQQEEEKRQKRLARNRASARLRRLRKKNLVDAYETEVGILEKTLQQLKAHDWGAEDNPRALTEALSMDRGQQVLTAEERKQAATDILEQQLQYIGMLEEVMQEQYVLIQLKDNGELSELQEMLQLSEAQLQQLADSAAGWEDEWNARQTVKASLTAMRDNNWLWNEGCMAVADEFMSILHKNQVSKFLLWADHNVEAIDELDGVNAPRGVPEGPLFHFGVNSNPESLLEEEKA